MELTTKQRLLNGNKFILISDEQEGRNNIYWIDSKSYINDSIGRQMAFSVLNEDHLHYLVRLPGLSAKNKIYYKNIKFV